MALETSGVSEMDAVRKALEDLGFLQRGARESATSSEEAVTEALRAYQRSRGLAETGVLDEDTLYSLTDPQEWRGDITELASVPNIDPETSITFDLTSGTSEVADAATGSSAPASLRSEEGLGTTVADTNLSAQELLNLSALEATYAPYEEEQGRRDKDGPVTLTLR